MHYLLFYEKGPGYAERQKPFVEAHHHYLESLVTSGHLIFGGSMENPADGSALLLFRADSSARVETFAKADPYVLNGVVSQWSVRPLDIVVGIGLTTL